MHKYKFVTALFCFFLFMGASATGWGAHRRAAASRELNGSTSTVFLNKPGSPKTVLSAGLGLPIYYGHVGVGLHLSAVFLSFRDYPVYLGAETGLNFFGSRYYYNYNYYYSGGYADMPLLFTGYFRFNIPRVPTLHPFGGVAVGPHFSLSGGRGVGLEMAARPGVLWNVARKLSLQGEVRVGVYSGAFFYEPIGSVAFLF